MGDLFKGRVAVVTGASGGIGRALAAALVDRGASVVAAARSVQKLEELATEKGHRLLAVPVDVADEASVRELVEATRRVHRRVDIVVNNAGAGVLAPFLSSDLRHWRETIDTNLVGTLLVTRAFLPAMLEGGRGVIINVGSSAVDGWPYLTLYSATKGAMQSASASLDREYAGSGVRILSVEIPPTHSTEFGSSFDREHLTLAMESWTKLGLPWDKPLSPVDSAGRILEALDAALISVG